MSKKAQLRQIKENEDLIKFIKSLTKEEIERIEEVRKHDVAIPGTLTWKISVLQDTVRNNIRQFKSTIAKRLWVIDDLSNSITRLGVQLETGKITEQMKNGFVMNESELRSLMQHHRWVKDGEFHALCPLLGSLRGEIMHKDVVGKTIMTVEEFDTYVRGIELYLKKYGYELFGELDG